MIKIGIVIGSTRPNRKSEAVAKWVYSRANRREDARFELIDIQDYKLPLLDEPNPPSKGNYTKPHTKRWAQKIASLDAFVFVTPEYNHGIPGALKNAIDFLYKEWNNKAAGFVAFGGMMGARSVEQLRLVMAEMQVATVRNQVGFSLFTDFEKGTTFKPADRHEAALSGMLDQVVAWGLAMNRVRAGLAQEAADSTERKATKTPRRAQPQRSSGAGVRM